MIRYVLVILFLLLGCLFVIEHLASSGPTVQAKITLQQALSDESGLFAHVLPGRQFSFPQDHGPHRQFKTEWWYFTGNLTAANGDDFGYQLTIFRIGNIPPGQSDNPSEWSSQSLYMGHLGLSDPAGNRFYTRERLGREGVGLAGALNEGERIWLEDWEIRREPTGWKLSAKSGEISLDLTLQDTKPPVLQGLKGYSRKGPEERHASYYVSQTRLDTTGRLNVEDKELEVSGTSWFDHEWSSEAMADGLVGWDWFSLQLDDKTEVMLYLLRYEDGRLEPASSGAFIDEKGNKTNLQLNEFKVEALASLRVKSGNTYPGRWRIEIPSRQLQLEVEPTMADQEMVGRVPYWEGAVRVRGNKGENSVTGRGFVELTGYSQGKDS